jgi:protein transport protein SEC24
MVSTSSCKFPNTRLQLDEANKNRWIGRDAVPALLADVFGVEDRTQLKQGKASLPVLDNEYSERVRAVVEKSRDHKSKGVGSIILPTLYIIKEDGDPSLKLWAQTLLVMSTLKSYPGRAVNSITLA